MNKFLGHAALICALFSFKVSTATAVTRLFVATTGLDTNVCSFSAPCRSLAKAVSKATPDSEILVKDAGGYGVGFTITKSVNIYSSVEAMIRTDSVPINVNGANVRVTIEGLTINGGSGIKFTNGATLSLRRINVGDSSAVGVRPDSNVCYADFVALGDGNGAGVMTVDDVVATSCYIGAGAGPLNTGGNGNMTIGNSVISDVQVAKGAWGSSACQTFGTNRVTNVVSAGSCPTVATQ